MARVAITGAIAFDGIDHGAIDASVLLSWMVQGSSSPQGWIKITLTHLIAVRRLIEGFGKCATSPGADV